MAKLGQLKFSVEASRILPAGPGWIMLIPTRDGQVLTWPVLAWAIDPFDCIEADGSIDWLCPRPITPCGMESSAAAILAPDGRHWWIEGMRWGVGGRDEALKVLATEYPIS